MPSKMNLETATCCWHFALHAYALVKPMWPRGRGSCSQNLKAVDTKAEALAEPERGQIPKP